MVNDTFLWHIKQWNNSLLKIEKGFQLNF